MSDIFSPEDARQARRKKTAAYLRGVRDAESTAVPKEGSTEYVEGFMFGTGVDPLPASDEEQAVAIRDWIIDGAHAALDLHFPDGREERGRWTAYTLHERVQGLIEEWKVNYERAKSATHYQVGRVTIELDKSGGTESWIVARDRFKFTRNHEWIKEPLPAYQGPDFVQRTHFESLTNAFRAAEAADSVPLPT